MRGLPCFGFEPGLILNTMYAIRHPQRSPLTSLGHDSFQGNIVWVPHETSVGNRTIDSEHNKLLEMINGIAGIIAEGKLTTLPEMFELLENGLCDYFVTEENIAQELGFDFEQHKLAHQHLLNNFKRIKDALMARNGKWTKFEEEGYICSLMVYLYRHIKVDND